MKRRGSSNIDAPGQDSFLDIVANLVGILIILVIIVGVRARDALDNALSAAAITAEEAPDVEAARAAADAVESSIRETEAKVNKQNFEILYRQKERDKSLLLVTALERKLEEQTNALNAAQRDSLERQQQLAEASYELAKLNEQRESLEQQQQQTKKVIRHLPTPMAKTVFGREAHFRLQNGRLMFVPWDEFIAKLKAEAPQKVWKLQDASKITETIGPIGGFWMKYTLKRASYAVETRVGAAVQKRVELERFILLPVTEGAGETLAQARDPQSEFREVLSHFQPGRTTITVWVYPDSFEEFRLLKEDLFEMGYLTAGRPLPEDQPIGGSPQGTRSAGQ